MKFYRATRRHMPEDRIVLILRLNNLKISHRNSVFPSFLLRNTRMLEVVTCKKTDWFVQQLGKLVFIFCFFRYLKITSATLGAVKLSLFMPMPFRKDRVTSHIGVVSQFIFVLQTVAVALYPSGFKDYHIYHDIPPSSFGHLLVTRAQKLPHSSSLSLYFSFYLFLLCIQKRTALVFCFSLYTCCSWIS